VFVRLDAVAAPAYACLLGVYLGDGCLTVYSPTRAVLRISCAAEYPALIADITNAIELVQPGRPVRRVRTPHRCVVLACWSPGWPSLLPQHGPGRKHAREIALQPWQRRITHEHPESFVRGLMHSDGCRFLSRQPRRGRIYTYARYSFSNRSEDIKALLCEHLGRLGIAWSRPNAQQIQIARRADVTRLDGFVGPKG
jgi:hypothetical protein